MEYLTDLLSIADVGLDEHGFDARDNLSKRDASPLSMVLVPSVTMTAFAPASAIFFAMLKPMPPVDIVTSAILLDKSIVTGMGNFAS